MEKKKNRAITIGVRAEMHEHLKKENKEKFNRSYANLPRDQLSKTSLHSGCISTYA